MKTPMSSDTKLTKDEELSAFVHASKRIPKPLILKRLSVSSDILKKQTALVISTTEAEYVSSKKACQKALWMKQALIDYDIRLDDVPIMYDNKGATEDYGTKRGRHFTSASSSSAFDHPLSSHHIDDDNEENDEGTSRTSIPSPTRFVNSLSNEIPQVFSNPSDDEQSMQTLFTCQTEIRNRQVQMRDEHSSALRLIGKGIKNLWKGKKK
ncbi:hypothetical protein Tco_0085523 [Tanacetum coccineum]